jgi:thiol-disulfide isomerase/thioredoxin
VLAVTAGPLVVPTGLVSLAVGVLVAAAVGHWAGRRRHVGIVSTLADMLLAAFVAARIAFVVLWFEPYRSAPWSMLDLRDGGFSAWAGVVAAALVGGWQAWRHAPLRKPLLLGLLAGAFSWSMTPGLFRFGSGPALADLAAVPLATMQGAPASLTALAGGKPMVVNLWATWCPPCRREMPVLAAAQQRASGVSFVFANQGEDALTIEQYLVDGRLELANVVRDPAKALGQQIGSMGLPTTLFYDAEGRLVDTHIGALSAASLAGQLQRLSPAAGAGSKSVPGLTAVKPQPGASG